MTSTHNPLTGFVLTPQQQNLLFAALNSNKAAAQASASAAASNSALILSPSSLDGSPSLGMDGVGSYQNSPDLEYDYDFGAPDSSFDFSFNDADQAKMIGDIPGAPSTTKSDSPEGDSPDKRSHPDDDEEENTGAKRREGEDKVAKKPGRKPLTTEPSSVSLITTMTVPAATDSSRIEAQGSKPGCSTSIPGAQGKARQGFGGQGARASEVIPEHESRKRDPPRQSRQDDG